MCHAGVALSQPLCLALLSVFEACGQSQQAQDVLTAASNASLPLTTDLYNAVLRCCVLEQHGERAVEVWEEMQVCSRSTYATRILHLHRCIVQVTQILTCMK